jgi:hypothetical protein
MKEHHVVGVGRQIRILLWKNWVLFKRNKSGTACEILVALLFVLILLVLRYFVDSTKRDEQGGTMPRPVISYINSTTNRSLIMYYPNNSFVQNLTANAYNLIKLVRPDFNATSKTPILRSFDFSGPFQYKQHFS